jgi:hypothetical protein
MVPSWRQESWEGSGGVSLAELPALAVSAITVFITGELKAITFDAVTADRVLRSLLFCCVSFAQLAAKLFPVFR